MKYFFIFFYFVFNVSPVFSDTYLYCRGPLEFIAGLYSHTPGRHYTSIKLKASSHKAGSNGRFLDKGSCAWKDRVLNADEIKNLHVDERDITLEPLQEFPRTLMVPLYNCLQNDKCVFKTGVENRRYSFEDNKEYFFYFPF